jgi:RNA polymerase sigma-70 factor (ECF subfamily)
MTELMQQDWSPDEQLLEAIARGAESALRELYDRFAGPMWAVARRLVGDDCRAEDVVQDVFVRLWERAGDYDSARGTVRTWLLVQVRSRSIDVIRSERARSDRERHHDPTVIDLTNMRTPDEVIAREFESSSVVRALDHLPPPQRQAIELAFFDGLSYRQIAKMLELPEGTVKGRIRLALERLRAEVR